MSKKTNEPAYFCEYCGRELTAETVCEFDGVMMCSDCMAERTVHCDCCGDRIWNEDDYGNDSICLCETCRDDNYTRCNECDALITAVVTVLFTNTATNPSRYSTAAALGTSEWSWRSTAVVSTRIKPR